jgi:hypothetical protein
MSHASSFDFDAAVVAPFRMQPGLRRMAEGSRHLTAVGPGSRHQREKLAVFSAFPQLALRVEPGFNAGPALERLYRHAAHEHPDCWCWDGDRAVALHLGVTVSRQGHVVQHRPGRFGQGDEVARCLRLLDAEWRLAGLLALAFVEDLAIVDGDSGCVPWMAVALPSHWAPEAKVGRHFREIHAPVADSAMLIKAGDALMRLVVGDERWERFVWNVTDEPRLHAHPRHAFHGAERWRHTAIAQAWFRSERQTFIPLPGLSQAVFTIEVAVRPLSTVVAQPAHAAALHDAVASMSEAVLDYRGLRGVRDELLHWLAARR